MDVREVLVRARAQAGLDQRRLAVAAGTARTTVVSYESGARSPTVRQLTRLLAACGLRARVVLEPLTADVDERLDEAVSAPPPEALQALPRFARRLSAGGVSWALDGATAVAVQGLAVPHAEPAVALVDDEASRRWLRQECLLAWNRDGFVVPATWHESEEKVREYTLRPLLTPLGFLRVRLVEALPEPVLAVQVGVHVHPVLPLVEVRRAWPALAELLVRHEERPPRTV